MRCGCGRGPYSNSLASRLKASDVRIASNQGLTSTVNRVAPVSNAWQGPRTQGRSLNPVESPADTSQRGLSILILFESTSVSYRLDVELVCLGVPTVTFYEDVFGFSRKLNVEQVGQHPNDGTWHSRVPVRRDRPASPPLRFGSPRAQSHSRKHPGSTCTTASCRPRRSVDPSRSFA
jgi:hypothetical protein